MPYYPAVLGRRLAEPCLVRAGADCWLVTVRFEDLTGSAVVIALHDRTACGVGNRGGYRAACSARRQVVKPSRWRFAASLTWRDAYWARSRMPITRAERRPLQSAPRQTSRRDQRRASGEPPNKGMKLTKLSAAPLASMESAASCPRRPRMDAGTASQLIPGVRRTCVGDEGSGRRSACAQRCMSTCVAGVVATPACAVLQDRPGLAVLLDRWHPTGLRVPPEPVRMARPEYFVERARERVLRGNGSSARSCI